MYGGDKASRMKVGPSWSEEMSRAIANTTLEEPAGKRSTPSMIRGLLCLRGGQLAALILKRNFMYLTQWYAKSIALPEKKLIHCKAMALTHFKNFEKY